MSKHLYFLGIGGTLMGSLAQLAKQMGYAVSGSDGAIYPPMSDQLAQAGIRAFEGFDPAQLDPPPDQIIIGNAGLPRGHAAVEYILERNLSYTSGAEWLGSTVLQVVRSCANCLQLSVCFVVCSLPALEQSGRSLNKNCN